MIKRKITIILLAAALFLTAGGSIMGIDLTGQSLDLGGASGTSQGSTEPRKLEVEYPTFPPAPAPTTTSGLPVYVKYIYYFLVMTSGLVALVVMIMAGFQYLSSAGNPSKVEDAKDRIKSALIGLLILVCSWMILNTINPRFLEFRDPDELPSILPDLEPGVYLCKEAAPIDAFWSQKEQASSQFSGKTDTSQFSQKMNQQKQAAYQLEEYLKQIREKCLLLPSSGVLPKDFDDAATFAYLVPSKEKQRYGVILYEEPYFSGKAAVLYEKNSGSEAPRGWPLSNIKASSARPFVLIDKPPSGYNVVFYEGIHKNRDKAKDKKLKEETCTVSQTSTDCQNLPKNKDGKNEIGSIKINGQIFVVFFKDRNYGGEWAWGSEITVVSISEDNNLNDNPMGEWKKDVCVRKKEPDLRDETYPCAESAVAICANFY